VAAQSQLDEFEPRRLTGRELVDILQAAHLHQLNASPPISWKDGVWEVGRGGFEDDRPWTFAEADEFALWPIKLHEKEGAALSHYRCFIYRVLDDPGTERLLRVDDGPNIVDVFIASFERLRPAREPA